MVGSSIIRNLIKKGYQNIYGTYYKNNPSILNTSLPWTDLEKNGNLAMPEMVSFHKIDLQKQNNVKILFDGLKPDIVIMAAAKVGGILANNTFRADFIYNKARYSEVLNKQN